MVSVSRTWSRTPVVMLGRCEMTHDACLHTIRRRRCGLAPREGCAGHSVATVLGVSLRPHRALPHGAVRGVPWCSKEGLGGGRLRA